MNFAVIILIIIVIILLYYLYTTYISVKASTNTKYDLNSTNAAIAAKSLTNNGSAARCSYSVWIYVNSWSNTNTKTIISRGNDVSLYLDQTTPSLKCIIGDDGHSLSLADKTTTITQNFPLQKWTYVILSMDNKIIDIYIDGKLVMSKKINYQPVMSINDISIGDSQFTNDIFLTTITYNGYPMDPQTAWNNYLKGNGMNNNFNVNMKLSVLQDNIEQGGVSLF